MRLVQRMLLDVERLVRGLRRRLRNRYYAHVLKSMGRNCQICDGVTIADPHNITIGDRATINEGVILQSCEGACIRIGNDVTLSYGAKLITGGLTTGDQGALKGRHQAQSIILEDSVWIGAGAIVLPGISIRHGAIVAAGSVVSRDVDEFLVVSGIPAKAIRKLKIEAGKS